MVNIGLLQELFKKPKENNALGGYFNTLTAYQPAFRSFNGGLYEMDVTRAAVHTYATHCSKLKAHCLGNGNKQIERLLQYRVNRYQTASQWLYRTATILECENTCFVVPILGDKDEIKGLYSICPSSAEVREAGKNGLFLRFQFANGEWAAIEWDKVGVLTKMQYKDDLFGSPNTAILPTMQLIDTQNQGIMEGIKNAAAVRFLARLGTSLREESILEEQRRFRENNLSSSNNGGVLMVDAKYSEVRELTSKPYVVDAEQMQIINNNVMNYFGVSEKILRNEWDEATWTAYYEGKVEPFAIQLALVLTSMFFTEHEVAFGNEIQFSANRLQFASISTKNTLITSMFDRGILSVNEGREILQMPPIPGGDVYMIRGEYVSMGDKTSTENSTEVNEDEQ